MAPLGEEQMIRYIIAILLTILATTATAIAQAEPHEPPTIEDIRTLYAAESATWKPAPPRVVEAFMLTEDKNFFRRDEGRSTITLLVARRFMPLGARGLTAMAHAILVGRALSHDEIIDWYIHTTHFGLGCDGLDDAAIAYFGKTVEDLTVSEYAYLAGLPQDPYELHPIDDTEDAIKRRNYVLTHMLEAGVLTEAETLEWQASELAVLDPLGSCD